MQEVTEFDSKIADDFASTQQYDKLQQLLDDASPTSVMMDWLSASGMIHGHPISLYYLIRNYIKPRLFKTLPTYETWIQHHVCRLIVTLLVRVAQDLKAFQGVFGAEEDPSIYKLFQEKLQAWVSDSVPDIFGVNLQDVIGADVPDIEYPSPVWVETFTVTMIPGCTTLYWNTPFQARRRACFDHEGRIIARLTEIRSRVKRAFLNWASSSELTMSDLFTFGYDHYMPRAVVTLTGHP